MTRRPVTVILTCGGGPGILAQVEALRCSERYEARIVLADANPASGNLFLPEVDARYRLPLCQDPDFIPALRRLIEAEGATALYSGLDEEMPVLSRHREEFEALDCRLLLPPAEALDRSWDKAATAERLDGLVDMPRTVEIDDETDPAWIWRELGPRLVIKATKSRGGRFIFLPEDEEELRFYWRRARKYATERGLTFQAQEFIDGDEYNVTTLHDTARRLIYAVSRRKFETRAIKSTTTAAVIERRQDIIDLAVTAVEAMDLVPGFNNVEVIADHRDGRPYFIEINGGRTAAQDLNLIASGINVTDLLLDIVNGDEVEPIDHPPDGLASLKIRRDVIVPYSAIEAVSQP